MCKKFEKANLCHWDIAKAKENGGGSNQACMPGKLPEGYTPETYDYKASVKNLGGCKSEISREKSSRSRRKIQHINNFKYHVELGQLSYIKRNLEHHVELDFELGQLSYIKRN